VSFASYKPSSAPCSIRLKIFKHSIVAAREYDMMLQLMRGGFMRTTITLDDELVRTAQEYTGVAEKTALIREALKSLIERESSRRLAALGGTMPELEDIPRRRPE